MRRSWRAYALAAPFLLLLAAASALVWGHLQPKPPGYAPNAATNIAPAAPVTVEAQADAIRLTIDARDKVAWVFVDLERAAVVDSSLEAMDWDLALRRTNLLTNSGLTNPRGPGGAIDEDGGWTDAGHAVSIDADEGLDGWIEVTFAR